MVGSKCRLTHGSLCQSVTPASNALTLGQFTRRHSQFHTPLNGVIELPTSHIMCVLFQVSVPSCLFIASKHVHLQSQMLPWKGCVVVRLLQMFLCIQSSHKSFYILIFFHRPNYGTHRGSRKSDHCMIKFKHQTSDFSIWFNQTNWCLVEQALQRHSKLADNNAPQQVKQKEFHCLTVT